MPLDADDARTLSPAALKLGKMIGDAFAVDGDGGKVITKREGKAILAALAELFVVLVKDLLD